MLAPHPNIAVNILAIAFSFSFVYFFVAVMLHMTVCFLLLTCWQHFFSMLLLLASKHNFYGRALLLLESLFIDVKIEWIKQHWDQLILASPALCAGPWSLCLICAVLCPGMESAGKRGQGVREEPGWRTRPGQAWQWENNSLQG